MRSPYNYPRPQSSLSPQRKRAANTYQFRMSNSEVHKLDLVELSSSLQKSQIEQNDHIQQLQDENQLIANKFQAFMDQTHLKQLRNDETVSKLQEEIFHLKRENHRLDQQNDSLQQKIQELTTQKNIFVKTNVLYLNALEKNFNDEVRDIGVTARGQLQIVGKRIDRIQSILEGLSVKFQNQLKAKDAVSEELSLEILKTQQLQKQLILANQKVETAEIEVQTAVFSQEDEIRARIMSSKAENAIFPDQVALKKILAAFTEHDKQVYYSFIDEKYITNLLKSVDLLVYLDFHQVVKFEDLKIYLVNMWNKDFENKMKFFLKKYKCMSMVPERLGYLGMRLFETDRIEEDDAEDIWMMVLVWFIILGGSKRFDKEDILFEIGEFQLCWFEP